MKLVMVFGNGNQIKRLNFKFCLSRFYILFSEYSKTFVLSDINI
jgi:hypothetical protein